MPGGTKLRLGGDVDADTLARVLEALRRLSRRQQVRGSIWRAGEPMRRGFDSLAAQVQTVLSRDPHDGALFVFRGKRGDLVKAIWWDGQGMCLFAKRLERGPSCGRR